LTAGFYARRVCPGLVDWAMRGPRLAAYRRRAIAASRGMVLEIGIGTGLNLLHYPPAVDCVYGIDPSLGLLARAARRVDAAPRPAVLIGASAEALPFRDAAFDTVVMTWTLCSIPRPATALGEMRRVMKADGVLLFIEHGAAPEAGVRRWQDRVTPCWRCVTGGCHLNREIPRLIGAAGFRIDDLETGYMGMPKIATFLYQGRAVRE